MEGHRHNATDARRAQLTFGPDDIGRQLERLGLILDYAAGQGKELRAVNLMVEKNIPVVLVDPNAPEPSAAAPVAQPAPTPKKPAATRSAKR